MEEGNKNAIELFSEVHSAFLTGLSEEFKKLVDNFKIKYDSINLNKERKFNFKRTTRYVYEKEIGDRVTINHFSNIDEAFKWYKSN